MKPFHKLEEDAGQRAKHKQAQDEKRDQAKLEKVATAAREGRDALEKSEDAITAALASKESKTIKLCRLAEQGDNFGLVGVAKGENISPEILAATPLLAELSTFVQEMLSAGYPVVVTYSEHSWGSPTLYVVEVELDIEPAD